MSKETVGRECSECGAIMSFVCFVDKKTKLEIVPGFTGKGIMSEELLSGALRKYHCPNGHEEING